MRPVANLANVYDGLPIVMNVTQKNILKDRWKKTFVVQQFNAEHQFAGKQCLEKKNLEA